VIRLVRIVFRQSLAGEQPDTMDVELLIVKVKENSAIYDASDKNHSNRNYIVEFLLIVPKIGM
jgi:hypothetical protein